MTYAINNNTHWHKPRSSTSLLYLSTTLQERILRRERAQEERKRARKNKERKRVKKKRKIIFLKTINQERKKERKKKEKKINISLKKINEKIKRGKSQGDTNKGVN